MLMGGGCQRGERAPGQGREEEEPGARGPASEVEVDWDSTEPRGAQGGSSGQSSCKTEKSLRGVRGLEVPAAREGPFPGPGSQIAGG